MDIQKIILWSVPRSCSTVFTKAMSQVENLKAVFEPFTAAFFNTEEDRLKGHEDDFLKPNMYYRKAKQSLENDFNDFSVIFCKDMGFAIQHYLDCLDQVLPEGYQHTFMIRNPRKTIPSLQKVKVSEEFLHLRPTLGEFKPLHDLFFTIKERTGQTPFLLDADDLLENPGEMLRKYCTETGLTFTENMLKWEKSGMGNMDEVITNWQGTLTGSTGFIKPSSAAHNEVTQLSEGANTAVEDNLVYYKRLYQYRMTC